MKIVIDSNRVIASLVKDSTTREILFDNYFDFFAPSFIKSEIYKYKKDIIKSASSSKENFDLLLDLIFESITIIPEERYSEFIREIANETKDKKDLPYFAVCLLLKAEGIWTHDLHFQGQKRFKIFTNMDMLKMRD